MRHFTFLLAAWFVVLVVSGGFSLFGAPALAAADQTVGIVPLVQPGATAFASQLNLLRHDVVQFAIRQAALPARGSPPALPCPDTTLLGSMSTGPGVDPGRRWDLDESVPPPADTGDPAPAECLPS